MGVVPVTNKAWASYGDMARKLRISRLSAVSQFSKTGSWCVLYDQTLHFDHDSEIYTQSLYLLYKYQTSQYALQYACWHFLFDFYLGQLLDVFTCIFICLTTIHFQFIGHPAVQTEPTRRVRPRQLWFAVHWWNPAFDARRSRGDQTHKSSRFRRFQL